MQPDSLAIRRRSIGGVQFVSSSGLATKIRPFPTSDNVSYVRLALSNYRDFIKFVGKHRPT